MNPHPLDFELSITDLENKVAELAAKRPSEDPLLMAARQDFEKERKKLYGNDNARLNQECSNGGTCQTLSSGSPCNRDK